MSSTFQHKFERSSFGSTSAAAARKTVTPSDAARVAARAGQISSKKVASSRPKSAGGGHTEK